jgi:hypothetical protein
MKDSLLVLHGLKFYHPENPKVPQGEVDIIIISRARRSIYQIESKNRPEKKALNQINKFKKYLETFFTGKLLDKSRIWH